MKSLVSIQSRGILRRTFLKSAATATAIGFTAPAVVTASKTESQIILGEGDYRYEVIHDCVQLPASFRWQTTHNVSVDREGNLYVIHEGQAALKDHPAIFVFDSSGKYVRSFGQEFQGGGHGLEVHTENGEQFLYVTAYQGLKKFAKLSLKGDTVWERRAPMVSMRYAEGEDSNPKLVWGRNRFMPTNIAFRSDGGFYLADGYGAWCIHEYDKDAKYLSTFGSIGKLNGQFDTPHGICMDDRPGREPSLVIADRANNRLQWMSMNGKHLKTMDGFLLPANLDTYKDLLLVPELKARISILDRDNNVVARLGEDPVWRAAVLKDNNEMRKHPDRWQAGKFIHPHDACFDNEGNIYVAEWVSTGRITKLKRLGTS